MICLHCQVEFAYVLLKLLGSEQHTEKQPRQPRWYQFTQFDAHPFQNSKKKRCFHFFGCKVTLLRGIIRNFGGNFPSPKPFFLVLKNLKNITKQRPKSEIRRNPASMLGTAWSLMASTSGSDIVGHGGGSSQRTQHLPKMGTYGTKMLCKISK